MSSCSCMGAGCKLCKNKGPAKLFIPIDPMGAVRTTQRQKFKDERAARYYEYKKALVLFVNHRIHLKEPLSGPLKIDVTFYMPIPKSRKTSRKDATGKRKQYPVSHGQSHIAKPDIDNLIKGLFDALNKNVWNDDNQICEVKSKKVYGDIPGIEFSLLEY